MEEARIALLKIFHIVRASAEEGIPYRGHNDDDSQFTTFLKIPELNV